MIERSTVVIPDRVGPIALKSWLALTGLAQVEGMLIEMADVEAYPVEPLVDTVSKPLGPAP